MRRLRSGEKGQSMVEFAMVMPLLLFLALGIADFGRAFFTLSSLSNGAREGARGGIVRQCSDTTGANHASVQYKVVQGASGVIVVPSSGVAITYPDGNAALGNRIRVTASTTYTPLTPIIGNLTVAVLGGTITLSEFSEMLIEQVLSTCP
ncbi:MAG: pilus assembly protein [Dehalococcoidia bacterium]|nr:pilus assembly protein [Dehalococcoidia bacterium]